MSDDFWDDPEIVRTFAEREPDVRLLALLESPARSGIRRALDIGCAGGRNTVLLARLGIEVHALDAAAGMVAETRRRLAELVGPVEAGRRVRQGRMADLGPCPDGWFDLVLALGVWHSAANWTEWQRAVAEGVRVLAPGGRLMLSHFTPETDMTGKGVTAVAGERHTYSGFPTGPAVLLDEPTLIVYLRQAGLEPSEPLATLITPREPGCRVSVNGELRRVER